MAAPTVIVNDEAPKLINLNDSIRGHDNVSYKAIYGKVVYRAPNAEYGTSGTATEMDYIRNGYFLVWGTNLPNGVLIREWDIKSVIIVDATAVTIDPTGVYQIDVIPAL